MAQPQTSPITIRVVHANDARAMADIYAPLVLNTAVSFETVAPTESETRERIEAGRQTHPWLVCTRGGDLLGYAYASPHRSRDAYRWSAECSVYVAASARKLGVGRALYMTLFEVLRYQGYCNVYAGITQPNAASAALHASVGFASVGVYEQVGYKFGTWHDVAWYQLTIAPRGDSPCPPTPFSNIMDDATLEALLRAQQHVFRA